VVPGPREDDSGGVAEFQRARLIAAMVEVVDERGMGEITVADIVARSGVSRRTFYELFADREECFLAAFDESVRRACATVLPAFRAAGGWRERIRAALQALLEFLDDEPGLGALCVVEALGAGAPALERRAEVVRALIEAVDEGREQTRGGARLTQLTSEGVVGAVLAVLHARLSDRERAKRSYAPLVELLGPLMAIVVLPYQGRATAAREATRPVLERPRALRSHGDPLRGLDMRLTYRTVRVLMAIAERPGASNRRVGEAAGVADQGQISKLLTRLEHLGLISNSSPGHTRGEPNVWSLTPKGQELQRTIHSHIAPVEARQD
jgi:AcrR family transcriptional regulator